MCFPFPYFTERYYLSPEIRLTSRHRMVLLLVLLSGMRGFAQDGPLDKEVFRQKVNQYFGSILSPESKSNVGNFASLDLKEAEVNFAGNIVFDGGVLLTLKAKGAVTDGFLAIFNNNELNKAFGAELQLNVLAGSKTLRFQGRENAKYKVQLQKIESEYQGKRIEIRAQKQKLDLELDMQALSQKISANKEKVSELSGLRRDSLNIVIAKDEQTLVWKQQQILTLRPGGHLIEELEQWKEEQIAKAQSEVVTDGFSLNWFSFGYGLFNNEFRLFDGSRTFADQVTKTSYDTHKVNIQFNHFTYQRIFYAIGGRYERADNFDALDKVEISETIQYGPTSGLRSKTRKFTAYEGEYEKDLDAGALYGDLYWFFSGKDQTALHFYPEQKFLEKNKPSTNLGLGLLLAFKNKDKTENIINAELYIKFQDAGNNAESENDLFERSTYGLRFTFPINFNTKI